MDVLGGADGLLNDSWHSEDSLLNITKQQQQQDSVLGLITDNRVTDSQLTTSLWLNALLGLIFFLSFCVLQRTVFPQQYRFRLVSPTVTVKPRDLPRKGFYSLWAWLWTALFVTDEEIMRSSGLDAMVMIKALEMGLEIFAPLAFIGCVVLLPVHYQYKGTEQSAGIHRSQLMQLTIAALPRGSDVMWLHFTLAICYNLWAMWRLARHFKNFMKVRQHYLTKGDDPNYWMALTQQADADMLSRKVRKLLKDQHAQDSCPPKKEPDGGPDQLLGPVKCSTPRATDRLSAPNDKESNLGRSFRRAGQFISREVSRFLNSSSQESYKPYTNEASPQRSPLVRSQEGSDQRMVHINWQSSGVMARANAAGLAHSTAGSDGMDSSLRNSKDSSEGMASGPATAAGSESGASTAGGGLSGGGKRRSSGSSAGAAGIGGSEGGSVATSSKGGDASSGSESSGGGALAALDNFGKKLRRSGSRGSKGGALGSLQQGLDPGAAEGVTTGTPPTYQTINELHSLTAAQAASGGFGGQGPFWPSVPKHMRTITEDSLEYRLDASLGASRPSSRGGIAATLSAARNSSSGADGSPCAAAARAAHAAALAAANSAAGTPTAGFGSTCGLLSTDGSGSSSQVLQSSGPSCSSAFGSTISAVSMAGTGAAGGSSCGPSSLSRASKSTTAAGTGVPLSILGAFYSPAAAEEDSAAGTSRGPSLAGGCPAQHTSRESANLRASITSLDSIDERSSIGTCIIHTSAPSSPGLEGCSGGSSPSASPAPSPVPDMQGASSGPSSGYNTCRDVSFAGCGVALQAPFAEAAMAANSTDSSRSSSMHANTLDRAPLSFAGSGKQLQRGREATLGPISQEDVTVALVDEPTAAPVPASSSGSGSTAGRKKGHAHDCSVDFSKQGLPDLSGVDVFMLDPQAAMDGSQQQPTSPDQPGQQQAGPRWSPFANSDGIASSIAAAGVALGVGVDPLRAAAAHGRQQRKAKEKGSGGGAQNRRSAGVLKQQVVQLMQQQQPQQAQVVQQERQQSAFAQAAQQPRQPSPQQQQQQGGVSLQTFQPGFGRSLHSSSNGSSSTSTSSRQQRVRVQQASAVPSSSEPSPVSQNGTIPPCWSSASFQQQHPVQRATSSSNGTNRALSPVGGVFLQATAVAGAAVGAGQELPTASMDVVGANIALAAEDSKETIQSLLTHVLQASGANEDAHRAAYHWWKELPTDHCETTLSAVGHFNPFADKAVDRPLLAKPSVRFRKTINTWDKQKREPCGVNAQHYAVLVTDVEPCCPYPELEEAFATQASMPRRVFNWLGSWADRLTPWPRSWGAGSYSRYTSDTHFSPDSWPAADPALRMAQEQQLMGLQQCIGNSRLSLDASLAAAAAAAAAVSNGGVAGTPGGPGQLARRQSQLASGQTSTDGALATAGPTSGAGAAPGSVVGAASNHPLARLSQGSQLSGLSLLTEARLTEGRPEEQWLLTQAELHEAAQINEQKFQSGKITAKEHDKTKAKIVKIQEDINNKVADSERMAAISRGAATLYPAVGTPHAGLYVGGAASVEKTPGGGASRCSSFRSIGPWPGPRGTDSAVAGAAVGNPEFAAARMAAATTAGYPYSAQPTPRSPIPLPVHDGVRDRVDGSGAAAAAHTVLPQHRQQTTLISSSTLQLRLQQRSRVGSSARQLGAGRLDSGDLALHMFGSSSSNCVLGRPRSSNSAGGLQLSGLEGYASAPAGASSAAAAASVCGPSAGSGVSRGTSTSQDPSAAAAVLQQRDGVGLSSGDSSVGRRAGSLSLLTQQTPEQMLPGPPQQQAHQSQQWGSDSLPVDDQPTPAAQAAVELASLPPRYNRQHRSPLGSPRGQPGGPVSAGSARNSDSTNTPPTDGRRDSFDSTTSSQSYAARRPVLHFDRPMPPAAAAAGPSSPRSSKVGGAGAQGGFTRGMQPAGAGVQGMRPDSSGSSNKQLPTVYTSVGGSSSSSSLPPAGPHNLGLGSSGGGAAPYGSSSMHPSGYPPLPSRGRSGNSSSSFERQHSATQRCSPDHLAIIVPPNPQGPPSRAGTPGAAAAGACAAPLSAYPSVSHMNVPPQPWGLPADAALLSTSFSSGSKGFRAATTGGTGALLYPPYQQSIHHRWSAGGVAEQRSYVAQGDGPGQGISRVTSPQLAEHRLTPAATADSDKAPLSNGQQPSRPASTNIIDINARVEAAIADHNRLQMGPYPMIPDDVRGWGRVVWAFRTKELLSLPRRESYDIVSSTFARLFPKEFDRAIPVIKHKGVDKLLLQWEAAVAALERAELKRQRTGREPLRLTGICGPLLSCCAGDIGCGCYSCTMHCADSPNSSCCLPQGTAVRIIPELQETIRSLEAQIEEARRKAFATAFTPSWFVLFKTQSAAMMAASTRIYAHDNTKFQVHPAPGPEEVNWQHVWMSRMERDWRTALTWPLTLLLVLFPITLVTSAASRLEYVFCPDISDGQSAAFYWQWYCVGREQGSSLQSFMRAFITGWLPSLLLNLWLAMIMPRLVYLIVQMEGSCFSLSALERRIGAIFFYWDVYNMFLQGTIGSTFFQQVHNIIQSPEKLPNILGAALPDSSNFFMQFIAMRALFLIWLRLCVPHGGVWQNWMHYCCCPRICCSTCNTERDKSLTYGPRTPRYGFEMGHMLLMYLIALAFAIVSPLLLPFSVVWFAFAWLAWRHNLSYVYQRKYESGGMMFIFLFSRIVMCLVIGQLFTFCVLVVRGAYWQAFLIIAFMPALTLRYYRYCQARYGKGVEFGVPLDVANRAHPARVPALAYIPPPLQDRSWGWYPEWQKIWEGWGMPTYAAA